MTKIFSLPCHALCILQYVQSSLLDYWAFHWTHHSICWSLHAHAGIGNHQLPLDALAGWSNDLKRLFKRWETEISKESLRFYIDRLYLALVKYWFQWEGVDWYCSLKSPAYLNIGLRKCWYEGCVQSWGKDIVSRNVFRRAVQTTVNS